VKDFWYKYSVALKTIFEGLLLETTSTQDRIGYIFSGKVTSHNCTVYWIDTRLAQALVLGCKVVIKLIPC
jgi:hypothetical protein